MKLIVDMATNKVVGRSYGWRLNYAAGDYARHRDLHQAGANQGC